MENMWVNVLVALNHAKKRSYLSWFPIQNHVTVLPSRTPTARYPRVNLTDQTCSLRLMHLNWSKGWSGFFGP